MFGLVITTGESVKSVLQPVAPPKPATLEEEVAARGISAISLPAVRHYQLEYMRREQDAGRAGGAAEWTSETPRDFERSFGPIPGDVRQVIGKAETIPGSKVVVERFYEDPFVFVVRVREKRREEVCIAYWNAPGFNL